MKLVGAHIQSAAGDLITARIVITPVIIVYAANFGDNLRLPCFSVIDQISRSCIGEVVGCEGGLFDGIVHTDARAADGEGDGVVARVRGIADGLAVLCVDQRSIKSPRLPIMGGQQRINFLAVAVDRMLRLGQRRTAANTVQRAAAVHIGAGGGDGIGLVIRRVLPLVGVHREDQLRALLGDHIVPIGGVRGENGGIVQRSRCAGGDFDGAARSGRGRRGHADAGAVRQALVDGDGRAVGQENVAIRVAGDVCRTADGEAAVGLHIHAAALYGNIAGDGAAVHVERAVVMHIHTAAVCSRIIAVDAAAAADGAAVHIKCTAVHTHAMAFQTLCGGRSDVDDAADDGDAVGLQIPPAVFIFPELVRILAVTAFGQRKGRAAIYLDGVTFIICSFDAVVVEAEHHAVHRRPWAVPPRIRRQVVVTRRLDVSQIGNADPLHAGVVTVMAAGRAADGVIVRAVDKEHSLVAHIRLAIARVAGECRLVLVRQRAGPGGHGDRAAAGRDRDLRGHADAGVAVQTGRINGDGLLFLICVVQVEVVGAAVGALYIHAAAQRTVFPVIRDLHAAGNGHGRLVHKHAAAPVGGTVAGDAAAGHGEAGVGAVDVAHIHATAVTGFWDAADVADDGVAGDAAAAHGEAAVAHKHTAAVVVGRVAGDLHAVGHGELRCCTYAAAFVCGCVAGDGRSAGQLKRTIRIHAAAIAGAVAGDGAARRSERAAAHVHAAAAAGGVGVSGAAAADGTVRQGEAAAHIHIHAAAVGSLVCGDRTAGHSGSVGAGKDTAAILGGCVAGDGAVGHVEFAGHIYAAAVPGGRVGVSGAAAADGAAGHGERTAAIHTAALYSLVCGDRAAGHIERAAVHAHTAATIVVGAAAGHGVVGNDAAGHGEGAACVHTHAAAIEFGPVARDGAAVHRKGAACVHIHAAAIVLTVAAEGAAVHREGAAAGYVHRGTAILCCVGNDAASDNLCACLIHQPPALGIGEMIRSIAAVAVRQGECAAYIDRGLAGVHRNAVPVQAEVHAVYGIPGFPCHVCCNVLGQVVVARLRDIGELGNGFPRLGIVRIVRMVAVRAADGVPVGRAVVEVDDIAADGAVFTRLLQEYVAAAVVRDKITLVVDSTRVQPGNRKIPAGGERRAADRHTDPGRRIQALIADVEGCTGGYGSTMNGHINVVVRIAGVLVPRDLHIAGDGQPVTSPIFHTAAVLGRVAGDAAAAHVEYAVALIYAAALIGRRVVGDAAAVHVEIALFAVAGEAHIHAAAVIGRVAGDAAAVHVEGGILAHIHAAAANFGASRN